MATNFDDLTSKAKKAMQNATESELGQAAKKQADKAKEGIVKEWNTVDEKKVEDPNAKFYKKNWFVILMLILFFPVGLFLMWKDKKFGSGKVRIIVTVCVCVIAFLGYSSISDGTTSTSNTPKGNYYTIDPETGKKYSLDTGEEIENDSTIDWDAIIKEREKQYAANNYSRGEFEDMCIEYAKEVVENDSEMSEYYKFKKVKEKNAYSRQACGSYNAESWEEIQGKISENLYQTMKLGKINGASKANIYMFIDEDNRDMVTFYVEATN